MFSYRDICNLEPRIQISEDRFDFFKNNNEVMVIIVACFEAKITSFQEISDIFLKLNVKRTPSAVSLIYLKTHS